MRQPPALQVAQQIPFPGSESYAVSPFLTCKSSSFSGRRQYIGRMIRQTVGVLDVLYGLAMVAVVVGLDVLIFVAFYFRFFRH